MKRTPLIYADEAPSESSGYWRGWGWGVAGAPCYALFTQRLTPCRNNILHYLQEHKGAVKMTSLGGGGGRWQGSRGHQGHLCCDRSAPGPQTSRQGPGLEAGWQRRGEGISWREGLRAGSGGGRSTAGGDATFPRKQGSSSDTR